MDQKQLSKLWSVLVGALLVYALDSWIVTQGGKGIFGASLLTTDRAPTAMFAIPICSLLAAFAASVGSLYAYRSSAHGLASLPIIGFESLDMKAREARAYQGVTLVLTILLPTGALFHFWRKFGSAEVVATTGGPAKINGVWDWTGLWTWNDPARICTNISAKNECLEGATVLPGAEPLLFAVMTGAAAVAAVGLVYMTCCGPRSSTPAASDRSVA